MASALALLPEEEKEIAFCNSCLANPRQLHVFVIASLREPGAVTVAGGVSADLVKTSVSSVLLDSETQSYLRALYVKYSSSMALRRRLVSGNTLYYLQCLTDDTTRFDFISRAADPTFVSIALR